MIPYLQTDRVTLCHAKAEEVYPHLEPGFTLAILDGPYGVSIADWDRMGIDGLADWYHPHLEAVTRLMAPSASLYVWNLDEGLMRLDPVIRSLGWNYRGRITWDKGIGFLAGKCDVEGCRKWPDVTEVCGVYQREGIDAPNVAWAAGASDRNFIRVWLNEERERAGIPLGKLKALVDAAGGAGEMIVRHSFYESQWFMPTAEQWEILHRVWNEHGDPDGRPYLQRDRNEAARTVNALKGDYSFLRSEYESMRAPFSLPPGITNVWRCDQVQGRERIKGEDGTPLHPTQKPLLFADRIIRASSRPGNRILVPFGGTSREAVACHRLPAEEARHVVSIEMDRKYLDAVRGCFVLDPAPREKGQVGLFGGAP